MSTAATGRRRSTSARSRANTSRARLRMRSISVIPTTEISVVGITEVLRILKRAREVFALLLAEVDRRRPVAAVLIDFPDFNLRLAKELKKRGVPVIYYISPQV